MAWQIKAPAVRPFGSQFAPGFVTGACTLFALAACDIVSKSLVTSTQTVMKNIYADCVARGWCAQNGAATQWGMIQEAGFIGLPVKDRIGYNQNLPFDMWHAFLLKYVACENPYPVLMQVENGQALTDALTGAKDQPGLQRHAICFYGTQTEQLPGLPEKGGYLGADGDNATGWVQPVVYSLETLIKARPSSIVAFDFVVHNATVHPPTPPNPIPAPAPGNDGDIDLPPNVAADLQKQLAATQAMINDIAAALRAAQH